MTKKELLKNFPKPTFVGVCASCAYVEQCSNILPNFTKPKKCGGPFKLKSKSRQSLS